MELNSIILQSKLFPPPDSRGFVERASLQTKLEEGLHKPLTLVSAPAGYGKSSTVSHWVRTQNVPFCWVSLGAEDNRFELFLEYLLHSVRGPIPGFGAKVLEMLNSPENIPPEAIFLTLQNAFCTLNERLVMVLDDFHLIRSSVIHDLMETLLEFPPPNLHLVLICRSDPSLPITRYRLNGSINEIRIKELIFNNEDLAMFFQLNSTSVPSPNTISLLGNQCEGWVAGLKLLIYDTDFTKEESITNYNQPASFHLGVIMQGFMSKLGSQMKSFLLFTSVLRSFNEALSKAVCGFETEELINHLKTSDLFLIPLDNKSGWYRYHHLFAELLQNELLSTHNAVQIAEIHGKAANWCQTNGLDERALTHLLQAGDKESALTLFQSLRVSYLNSGRWSTLEQILEAFSQILTTPHPILELTKAWVMIYYGKVQEMFAIVDSIKDLSCFKSPANECEQALQGEFYSLYVYRIYHVDQDYSKCILLTEQALSKLPADHHYALGYAWIFWSGAMQALNRAELAVHRIYQALEKQTGHVNNSQLLALNFVYWLEGDPYRLKQVANHLLTFGQETGNMEAQANGNIFLGAFHYLSGKPEKALQFLKLGAKLRYHTVGIMSFFGESAMVYCLAYLKKWSELGQWMEKIGKLNNLEGGQIRRSFWETYSLEISLISGDESTAQLWVKQKKDYPLRPITNFSDPNLVLLRVCLTLGSVQSLKVADSLIASFSINEPFKASSE